SSTPYDTPVPVTAAPVTTYAPAPAPESPYVPENTQAPVETPCTDAPAATPNAPAGTTEAPAGSTNDVYSSAQESVFSLGALLAVFLAL
ncbi:hypothetical protein HDV03_000317, partial [Kappamyces sp. JEL0829]